MTETISSKVMDEAIAWHLRLRDSGEDGWIEFTQWLEADTAHNRAYESIVSSEAAWSGSLDEVAFPNLAVRENAMADESVGRRIEPVNSRRRWMAMAASFAIAGALAWQIVPRDQTYVIETAPGETRQIALADGGSIALNGSTRLVLDRKDARTVELTSGEAMFDVVHDAANPFAVTVGDRRIVDVGTRFAVKNTASLTRVAVAEGVVRYEGLDRPVELRAGDVLTEAGDQAALTRADPATIGGWSQGTLVFEGASYAEIAEDLSRSTGKQVSAASDVSGRRFSGVLQISDDLGATKTRVATLLNVSIEDGDGTWILRTK